MTNRCIAEAFRMPTPWHHSIICEDKNALHMNMLCLKQKENGIKVAKIQLPFMENMCEELSRYVKHLEDKLVTGEEITTQILRGSHLWPLLLQEKSELS